MTTSASLTQAQHRTLCQTLNWNASWTQPGDLDVAAYARPWVTGLRVTPDGSGFEVHGRIEVLALIHQSKQTVVLFATDVDDLHETLDDLEEGRAVPGDVADLEVYPDGSLPQVVISDGSTPPAGHYMNAHAWHQDLQSARTLANQARP